MIGLFEGHLVTGMAIWVVEFSNEVNKIYSNVTTQRILKKFIELTKSGMYGLAVMLSILRLDYLTKY